MHAHLILTIFVLVIVVTILYAGFKLYGKLSSSARKEKSTQWCIMIMLMLTFLIGFLLIIMDILYLKEVSLKEQAIQKQEPNSIMTEI